MNQTELDFSGVEDRTFERIPDGNYHAFVFDYEYRATRNGDDMYVFTFKVSEGQCKGMIINYFLPIMPKVMFRVKQFLSACGETVPDGKMSVDWDALIGKEIGIKVGTTKGDERDFADVKRVFALSGAERSTEKDDGGPWATDSQQPEDNPWSAGPSENQPF